MTFVPNQDSIIVSHEGPHPTPEEEAERAKRSSRFDGIAIGAAAFGLGGILYLIHKDISPFILMVTVALLLFPFREYRAARTILTTTLTLFVLWLAMTLSSILFPFIVAFVISYLFNPVVSYMKRKWKISRGWGAVIVVVILCSIVGFSGYMVIPLIVNEAQSLTKTISTAFQTNQLAFDEKSIHDFLISLGIPREYVTPFLNNELYPAIKNFTATLPTVMLSVVSALPAVLQRTLDIVLIPIASIYLLSDWNDIGESLMGLVPPKRRPHWKKTIGNIDKVLYGYIRGQSLVALIIGILTATALAIAGVPYYSLIGVLIVLLDFIPVIGLLSSVLVVEIVIMVTMPITFGNILVGVLIILGMHMIETYLLGPRIIGKGVGIPPILILASVFVFAFFFGFIGMLIAVPLTGVIVLFIREYKQAIVSDSVSE
ncbi:MAG TPA: AI-2E family transporter [Candidatus Kapabacteria bacterium]|nr:AI-2E family transporter [Candidatus Kapabacteria bacterium]